MKKFVLVAILIIVALLIFFNISKNKTTEKINKKQPIAYEASPSEKMKESSSTQINDLRYIDYSKSSFDQIPDRKRVYFFHATWCPTCKTANDEFSQNGDKIPSDVILFKTDYDTEKELKMKYGITYQHTFVYVDSLGDEVKKWNGGGIAELINNTTQ